jgi:hypothetical protein
LCLAMNACTFTVVSTLVPPVAEGAPVNASSKVAIVMAGLQPPEDMTSLGVEGLIVAVDVAALHLSCSTKDQKTRSQLQR